MKHRGYLICILNIIVGILISTSIFGQKIHNEIISSKVLGQERNILVYTPWQYDKYPEKRMEVIYVFDAQAREYFDLVHSMSQFMVGEEFAFIIIGIESPVNEAEKQSRDMDFLPNAIDKDMIKKYAGYTGGADKFLSCIKSEIIPFIDTKYRTLPEKIAVGHSNGATFISYSLLTEPDLFDAYIAISPNYAFDKGQFVKRFEKLDPATIQHEKFVFVSNANENVETSNRWVGWPESNKEIVQILNNKKFKSKINLVTKDFSSSENHSTTFPIGLFFGLKSFIDYQFRTADNVIDYYERLEKLNTITLTPELTNSLAYECFWNDRPKEAIKVINWAIQKFPKSHNLFDSEGEFYEKIGNLDKAQKSYKQAIDVLSKSKDSTNANEYDENMNKYLSKVQSLTR